MAKCKDENGYVVWTAARDALLGTMPDDLLGDKMGCNGEAVRRRRIRLDVPAFRAEFNWTPVADDLIARLPIPQAAKKLSISQIAVRIRRSRTGAATRRV